MYAAIGYDDDENDAEGNYYLEIDEENFPSERITRTFILSAFSWARRTHRDILYIHFDLIFSHGSPRKCKIY